MLWDGINWIIEDLKFYFLDSVDTVTAMQLMQSLVKQTNKYIGNIREREQTLSHSVISGIAKYLTRMLKMFGATSGEQEIGFPSVGGDQVSNVGE